MLKTLRKMAGFEDINPEAYEWHRQNVMTPDLWKLIQYQRQLIFVADDMMRGHKNHALIADAAALAVTHPTCYSLDKFTMWHKDLGHHSFPILMEETYKPTAFNRWPPELARVKGELYAIRPPQFIVLDKHRQNGVQFRRKRIAVTLPYRQVLYSKARPLPEISREYVHTVQAWTYVGIPEYWDKQFGDLFRTSGIDLREHDVPRPWIDKFYKFDK